METELKGLRERSEEVEAVMGQTPSWVFRWGITMIAVIVGCLLVSSWFVQCPDTLTAHGYIEVTSSTNPWIEMTIPLSAEQVRNWREGMEANVSLKVKGMEWGVYKGVVKRIPMTTDSTMLYHISVQLNKSEKTSVGNASIDELTKKSIDTSRPLLEATVVIALSNKRLLQRILKR